MKKSLSLLGPPEWGDLEKQMNVDIIISEHPKGLVTRNITDFTGWKRTPNKIIEADSSYF